MTPKRSSSKGFSYGAAGVDISVADAAKRTMAKSLQSDDKRVLNAVGAFASLYDARFPGYEHPVLALKTEEPGSKQLLAFQHGRVDSICHDMINHLVNDIVVMGATPLCAQDAVICGKLEKKTVTQIVASIAKACKAQGCVLTGGETSEQPGVLKPGTYVLTSSIIGIAERAKVIDGSRIRQGDTVLAVASNGLHTNGYTLVRALMKKKPKILKEMIGRMPFLDAILLPHVCYYPAVRGLFDDASLHGMAHITGGGIEGNLNRILPDGCDARVDASAIRILPVFETIREYGEVSDAEMLRTYNMGVGLAIVAAAADAERIAEHVRSTGHDCYAIGEIVSGKRRVRYAGATHWRK